LGERKTGRPEIAALQELQRQLALEDAQILTGHVDDEEPPEPIEFYVFWSYHAAKWLTIKHLGKSATAATWDAEARKCVHCIQKVRKWVNQRRKRYGAKIRSQARQHLSSRRDLIAASVEELREERMVRIGQQLERTTKRLRW
ncbi:hypothetical protein PHYSODRAFT_460053, partial [Phytophthora sojae]